MQKTFSPIIWGIREKFGLLISGLMNMHKARVGQQRPDIRLISHISVMLQQRQPEDRHPRHPLPARQRCSHMEVLYKRGFRFHFHRTE